MVSGVFPGKQGILSHTRGKPALGSHSRETIPLSWFEIRGRTNWRAVRSRDSAPQHRHSRLLRVTAGRRGLKTASGPGGSLAHPRAHPSPHQVPAPTLGSSPALSRAEAALARGGQAHVEGMIPAWTRPCL